MRRGVRGPARPGGQDEGPEDREVVWELEIEPDSDEDVTVSLEAWRPCDETGAICTADGRTLSTAISTTVRGPDEVAAPEPPDKPTGLEATASHDSVTLTWDDPGDDSITGYVILRRVPGVDPEGQFRELVADTGTDATTYTDNTVSAETRFTYRVKAINEHGVSERSRWFHIDTPAAPRTRQAQGALRHGVARLGDPHVGRPRRRHHHRLRDPAPRSGERYRGRFQCIGRGHGQPRRHLHRRHGGGQHSLTPTASRPSTSTEQASVRAGSTSTSRRPP